MLKNLQLKTKILLALFSLIFVGQITILSVLTATHHPIIDQLPEKMMILGPSLLLTSTLFEFFYFRYLKKLERTETKQKSSITYIAAFAEISFPAFILLIVGSFASNNLIVPLNELLSSPPFILYFILVILSSLHLDRKICAFSGLIAGVQYAFVCIYFKSVYNIEALIIPNILAKSVLIFVCGLVAGFVSEKIKSALIDALHAQDKLINQLDMLVKEKTKEITLQKKEIELQHSELQDKNKEIIDSIHYAKRIQQTFMPTDKYVEKQLKNLKK